MSDDSNLGAFRRMAAVHRKKVVDMCGWRQNVEAKLLYLFCTCITAHRPTTSAL